MKSSPRETGVNGPFSVATPRGLIRRGVHRGGAFLHPREQIEQMFGGEGGRHKSCQSGA